MSESYEIRAARPDDVDELPGVERAAVEMYRLVMHDVGITGDGLGRLTTEAEFREAQEAGRLWVAADADDRPVGFALVIELAGACHLEELDVDAAHGRRGLGTKLLNAVCHWAAEAGYPAVTLSTFRDVPWNAPYYARHGFRALEPDELGPELQHLVEGEKQRGLRTDLRVIMRRELPC